MRFLAIVLLAIGIAFSAQEKETRNVHWVSYNDALKKAKESVS